MKPRLDYVAERRFAIGSVSNRYADRGIAVSFAVGTSTRTVMLIEHTVCLLRKAIPYRARLPRRLEFSP